MKQSSQTNGRAKLEALFSSAKKIGKSTFLGKPTARLEPKFYFEIPIAEGENRDYREGYAIMLDCETFRPASAVYYSADGPGTYREEPLSKTEFKMLIDGLGLTKRDLFADLTKIMFK